MTEVLELRTSHSDVADVVDQLAPYVDDTSIELLADREIGDGEWVRFEVKLADGSTVLEGVGRCAGAGSDDRVRLTLLQFDMRNEIMFERIVLAGDTGEATGNIDISQLQDRARDEGLAEAKAPPPPPKRPPPPPRRPSPKPPSPEPPKKSERPRPPRSELPPPKSSLPPRPPIRDEATRVAPSKPPPSIPKPGEAPKPKPDLGPREPGSPAEKRAHQAKTVVAQPIDSDKTRVGPPPTREEADALAREPDSAAAAATVPDPESASAPDPASSPAPASDPPPAASPSENTAPQEIATLDTVVSRVNAPRRPSGDSLRLDVPARLVARARALAPTLPDGFVDHARGRHTDEEAVLLCALRMGLASLASIADADDD